MNKFTIIWLSILSGIMLVLITVIITLGFARGGSFKENNRQQEPIKTEQRQNKGQMTNQTQPKL